MERAIGLLPAEMRPFFEQYKSTLVERAIDPDTWQVAGFNDQEDPNHFLDLDWEGYGKYPYTGCRATTRRRWPSSARSASTTTARCRGASRRCTATFGGRSNPYERRGPFGRFDVIFFSAWLTHYVSDAHVPFHAVLNYDGQLTSQHGIHARYEAYLFERYRDQWTIAPKPIAPIKNPRDYIFDVVLQGTQLVPPILKSDLEAIGGRDEYDDAYYAAFFKANRAVARAPSQRVDCRVGGDDRRCVGSSGEAGCAGQCPTDCTAAAPMMVTVRLKADTACVRLKADTTCRADLRRWSNSLIR